MLILAVVIMLAIRGVYLDMFENFFPHLEVPGIMQALCVGGLLLMMVSIFNIIAVYGQVMSIWKRTD